jgi:GNAT superfamily N-acetyltransferase
MIEPIANTATLPVVTVRPMAEADLDQADRLMRLAFGTFLNVPDPMTFMGDADYVFTRWRANPEAAFVAEADGRLLGSNFATNWGSIGFFGPLTVDPAWWDKGVARRLIASVMDCFERWGLRQAGLFTFATSPKHLALYQKFGFWPRFLTAVVAKAVEAGSVEVGGAPAPITWMPFAYADDKERRVLLAECRQLMGRVYPGLDVSCEIMAVADQGLGETVLLQDEGVLAGVAVCHYGPRTEAGSGTCYIKFGVVAPGPLAGQNFRRLLAACEQLAVGKGLAKLTGGVNTARQQAYAAMLELGFRVGMYGVIMHRPNEDGYDRPDVYLIDDWR